MPSSHSILNSDLFSSCFFPSDRTFVMKFQDHLLLLVFGLCEYYTVADPGFARWCKPNPTWSISGSGGVGTRIFRVVESRVV